MPRGTTKKKPAPKRKGPAVPRYDGPYTREHQKADIRLADDYMMGKGVVRNPTTARRLLQRAAQGPDAQSRGRANYLLGNLYENGIGGHIKKSWHIAFEYFQKGDTDGYDQASFRMHRLEYFPDIYIRLREDEFAPPPRGTKSPGNLTKGDALYDQEKYAEALPILTYHAKRGSRDAQYTLAFMYALGEGVEVDKLRCRAWCYLAAKNGLTAAQTALGCEFFYDLTVADCTDEIEFWLKRAARRNDPDAIAHWGLVVMSGRDWRRKTDEKMGVELLYKAASLGSSFAMLKLGDAYLGKVHGRISVDRNKAKDWYLAAAEAGDQPARDRLRREFKIKYDGSSGDKIAPQKRAIKRTPKK